jgi:hypothetical protein
VIPLADLDQILSSSVWTALATLLAALAIGVSIVLYRKQRARKTLSFEMEITELVSVHSEARDQIKIFYGEEQVVNACLLQLQLENVGNVPITEADFEKPLGIALTQDGSPLTAEISASDPPGLEPAVGIADHAVQVDPHLLNPRDRITLKVIARNFTGFQLQYRIVGISRLIDAKEQAERAATRKYFLIGMAAGMVGVFLPVLASSLSDLVF